MASKGVLGDIRSGLEGHVGKRITVKTMKSRRRVQMDEGILERTYPNIFVVKVNASPVPRRVSYTYSDVLTRTVRIQVEGENNEFSVSALSKTA
ncbi:MAG: Veg protein [Firmicutes bacterium]|nr:Veg protein [Bacillota bacterium]